MKAVILEIIKEKAVVMKENGTVRRVRNKNYSVGDEIYMREGIFSHRRWAPIVAALLIFAMVGTGTWVYADDYQFNAVDKDGMDFMISVNRRGKVTSVEVDGEEIRFENDDIRDFLEELFEEYDIEAIAPMGDSEEDAKELAEEFKEMIQDRREEAEERAEEARERAEEALERAEEKKGDDDDNEGLRAREENMVVKGLSPEDVERAKDYDITPGKYNIITNLLNTDETDDEFEEYLVMSNQELMRIFTAEKGEKNGVKFQEDKENGRPENNGKPEEVGKPENVGKPEGVGNPDDMEEMEVEIEEESERPEDAGMPEGVGKPDGVGKPEGTPGN